MTCKYLSFTVHEIKKKFVWYSQDLVPFAVVGSNVIIDQVGSEIRRTRGRRYAWGVVDIEDESHCDFVPLRNTLVTSLFTDYS